LEYLLISMYFARTGFRDLISQTLHEPMQSAQVHRCFLKHLGQPVHAVNSFFVVHQGAWSKHRAKYLSNSMYYAPTGFCINSSRSRSMSPCSLRKCIGASAFVKHNHSMLSARSSRSASRWLEQALCQIPADSHALCPYGFLLNAQLLMLHEPV